MELRRYLHLIRQRLYVVILSVLVGALVGYGVTSRVSQYRTTAQLYVGSEEIAQNPSLLYLEPGLNQVVATFAEMIPTQVIAQKAVVATGVPRSAGAVVGETKAEVVTGTNLIDISVTDPDPVVAQKLANGVGSAFVAQIQNYQPGAPAGPGTVPTEPAYVFQTAPLPTAPLSSGLKRQMILGGIFGLLISVLLVLLLDYLDITAKTPEELERRLGLPVLGVVPLNRSLPEKISVG